MGPLGMQEMIVIFLVALLLFGPRKLPELGKTLAKAMTEFRRAQSDLKSTFDREMQTIERENETLKETTKQAAVEISNYSDFDLVGGDNHYGTQPPASPVLDAPASEPSNVSASEVPGADSPAGTLAASSTATLEAGGNGTPAVATSSPQAFEAAHGTVPRGADPVAVAEVQPAAEAAPHG